MSDEINEQPINEELGVEQDLADAVNDLLLDDEAPEVEASTDEPTEQQEVNDDEPLSTDDEEATDTDYLAVDSDNLDTMFEYEGEKATIGELFESHNNRTAPERLNTEREELASLRSELETRRESYSYIDLEDKPHEFFQVVFQKMVNAGTLPKPTAEAMISGFKQSVVNKEYDADSVEQKAIQLQNNREYQTRAEKLAEQESNLALRSEVIGLEAKYGKVTDVISEKIMGLIKEADRVGKQMTFTEAFAAAKTKGYFKQPPKSRPKLASEFRSKGTKSDAPSVQESSLADAAKAFY